MSIMKETQNQIRWQWKPGKGTNTQTQRKAEWQERYNYNISNNVVLLGFHSFSCTDTGPTPGILLAFANQSIFYGRQFDTPKPTGVFSNSLTLSPVKNWGKNFRATAKPPLGCPCRCTETFPSPWVQGMELQGSSSTLSAGNASSLIHSRTKHSLQEKKMSPSAPRECGGSAALNSVEWITKKQLCLA